MRIVLSLALVLHGLIHLVGFVIPWRLAEIRGFAYSTSVAWGRIDVGEGGARALGLGWLLSAAGGPIAMMFSTTSIVAAFACSTLIGVVFGFLPARNAARLDPVDALARE